MLTRRTVSALTAASALAAITAVPVAADRSRAAGPTRLDRATVVRWVDGYLRAWRDKDDVAVGELFTRDAVYQEVPGDPARTYVGRDAIRAYWRTVTKGQSQVTALRGEPVIQGERASVELWITLRNNGRWVTLIETNVLSFRNARVHRNAEYWILRDGRFAPPRGWGARP
ncbi:nuclear transport factor 2 family protein [Actinomadura kijaniata]|uniref:nuclear transport factor 2 family protein n=1 Tax=Actinomadura kijaniata TaxID=46161 RepID=UPI00082DDE5D|nr:nuclear transport factor 2 family protein [Actinomadura kijaniata]